MKIDSVIFDMDGTLWDAVDTYCKVWDMAFARLGVKRAPVTYGEMVALMGRPLEEIFDVLAAGTGLAREDFMEPLFEVEAEIVPRLGGRLYDGVEDVLRELKADGIRLFMVSNCAERGLDNFMKATGLRGYFTDLLSFGATGVDKDVNIRRLQKRYNLKRPVYVGDIQRDSDSTHAAGVEFVWAAYGFGEVRDADFRIDRFSDLKQVLSD